MQAKETTTSLVDQWLKMQKDIYIYAPDLINGANWHNDNIRITLRDNDKSPARWLIQSCEDTQSRNHQKISRDSFKALRAEMAGYLQIDVIESVNIQSTQYIPVVRKADIDIQEISMNWLPQGEIKEDLIIYLKYGLLQNNKNRSIVPVWLRWTDSHRYALFNWQ